MAMDCVPGRSRSFGGCVTCRRRHLKCDEFKPFCSTCRTAGIICGGYAKNIFFDFDDTRDEDAGRFRRVLFTETERKRMSEWLTTCVSPRDVARQLEEIDAVEEDSQNAGTIQRGPFGAFSSHPEASEGQAIEALDHATLDVCCDSRDLVSIPLIEIPLEGPISDPLLFDAGLWAFTEQQHCNEGEATNEATLYLPELAERNTSQIHLYGEDRSAGWFQSLTGDASSQTPTLPYQIDSTVPQDAVFLIKYFTDKVLGVLSPFGHVKTPWHSIFVPLLKNCLAALTLGEHLDHASLCSFFATLSLSAFSIGNIAQSTYWSEQGQMHFRAAQQHHTNMIEITYDLPKASKYKTVLVALLSMIHVTIFTGKRLLSESLFIEAEQFIRVKGLHRRKSRKVRLLHHCYVYERMFHESTYLREFDSGLRARSRKVIESSGAMVHSRDGLSFRIADWNNLEEQFSRLKSREDGENDLHLEKPGLWPATLYPEIFGIPEAYMFALSLVIRLGERKDDTFEKLDASAFLARSKIVEAYLHKLEPALAQINHQAQETAYMVDSMLRAMHSALLIYFYRRIYDLDASMLQNYVADVLECVKGSNHNGLTRLIWPAFIAACEAEEPAVQSSFATWFSQASQSTGLRHFDQACQAARYIWDQKRNTSRPQQNTWLAHISHALVHADLQCFQ